MPQKEKKIRTITSKYVPTDKEREQAQLEGSRFLTEEEKDEIEADVTSLPVVEE